METKKKFWDKIFGATPGDGEMQSKEALSFSLCGFGQNLICTIIGSYITIFMTDAIGFSAMSVAILMLLARLYDGFNDPIMGSVVDRTRTKWGKCRPYLKWMAFPIGAMTIICFLPWFPNTTGGFAALAAMYILWGMIYTVADVPFWGLATAMCDDTYRRGTMLTVARLFCTAGAGIVTVVVPIITDAITTADANVVNSIQTLVNYFTNGDPEAFGLVGGSFLANATGVLNAAKALTDAGVDLNVSGAKFIEMMSDPKYASQLGNMQIIYNNLMQVSANGALSTNSGLFSEIPSILAANTAIQESVEFLTGQSILAGNTTASALYLEMETVRAHIGETLRYTYFVAAIVCVVISMPLFMIGFKNTVERNQAVGKAPSLKHNFKLLFKNTPLMLIVISGIGGAGRMMFNYTGGLYFAKYVLADESLYTLFTMAVVPGGLIASLLVPWCTKKFGKRNTYIVSHLVGGVAMLFAFLFGIFYDYGNYSKTATLIVLVAALVVAGIPVGFSNVLTYAMIGDTVEYLELKTGERAEGICFAMQTLMNKIAMALGAFIGVLAYAMINTAGHSVVNNAAAVTAENKNTFWYMLMLIGSVSFFLTVIPLFFYKFNEKEQQEAIAILKKRREEAALAAEGASIGDADAVLEPEIVNDVSKVEIVYDPDKE